MLHQTECDSVYDHIGDIKDALRIEEYEFKDLDSKWESDISENSYCNDDYNF